MLLCSSVFLLLAVFGFWAAERRALQVCRRIEASQVEAIEGRNLKIIASVLSAEALALGAAIRLLSFDPL